jgi:hypothetical protein
MAEASPSGDQSESERLDVATDQAIAACGGNVRSGIKTIVDLDLHDGGSTSFTLVFLLWASNARSGRRRTFCRCVLRVRMFGWLSRRSGGGA